MCLCMRGKNKPLNHKHSALGELNCTFDGIYTHLRPWIIRRYEVAPAIQFHMLKVMLLK